MHGRGDGGAEGGVVRGGDQEAVTFTGDDVDAVHERGGACGRWEAVERGEVIFAVLSFVVRAKLQLTFAVVVLHSTVNDEGGFGCSTGDCVDDRLLFVKSGIVRVYARDLNAVGAGKGVGVVADVWEEKTVDRCNVIDISFDVEEVEECIPVLVEYQVVYKDILVVCKGNVSEEDACFNPLG